MKLPIEPVLTVDGKKYRLSKFAFDEVQEFLGWADSVLPNPIHKVFEAVDSFTLDEKSFKSPVEFAKAHARLKEIQDRTIDRALILSKKRLRINDPEITGLMQSPAGAMKICQLLFKKYHSELSDEQIQQVLLQARNELGDDGLANLIVQATGLTEQKEEEPAKEDPFRPDESGLRIGGLA